MSIFVNPSVLSLVESTITDDVPADDVSSLTEDAVLFDEQAAAEQIISADIMIDIYFFITFTSLMMHSSFFVRVYRNLACILSYVKGFLCSIK